MDGLTSQQHLDLLRALVVERFSGVRVIQSTSGRRIGEDRYEFAPRNSCIRAGPRRAQRETAATTRVLAVPAQPHRFLDGLRPPPTRRPGDLPDGVGRGPSADKEKLIVMGEIDGAAVEGHIVAPRVVIEEGAYVRGRVEMQRKVGRWRQASWQQRWPA